MSWMRSLLTGLVAAAALIAATLVTAPPAGSDTAPPFASVLFGRTQWVTTARCVPLAKSLDLEAVASRMSALGLSGVGNVVLSRTAESERVCWANYTLHASWDDIAHLRDHYGWSFVSAGATYADMTAMSPEEQAAESCGSLPAFEAHGHERAWGMFAYPNNKFSPSTQDVVAGCFAFGRTYRGGVVRRSALSEPWLVGVTSVNGGQCNNPALACYTAKANSNSRYMSPETLRARYAAVKADEWVAIQFYRLVEGKYTSNGFSWDCTSRDWRGHFTSQGELYCWQDFVRALSGIPDAAVVTDPATVAEAWGRLPAGA